MSSTSSSTRRRRELIALLSKLFASPCSQRRRWTAVILGHSVLTYSTCGIRAGLVAFLDPETGLQAIRSVVSLPIVMKLFTHINDNILHQATVAEF